VVASTAYLRAISALHLAEPFSPVRDPLHRPSRHAELRGDLVEAGARLSRVKTVMVRSGIGSSVRIWRSPKLGPIPFLRVVSRNGALGSAAAELPGNPRGPIRVNKTGSSQRRHLLNLLFLHMSLGESTGPF
jgi:hypothetical protein